MDGERRFPKLSFQTKVGVMVCWAMVIATWLPSYSIYTIAMSEANRQLGQRLMAVAVSGAAAIDGDVHETLTQPGQMDTPAYRKIQTYLRELRDQNSAMKIRYVYTMAPTDKPGFWKYVVDAEPSDSRFFSFPGETEDFTY